MYPEFQRIKEGTILLTADEFPSVFGYKFGVEATGGRGTLKQNTDHIWAGTSSVKLTSGNQANDTISVISNVEYVLPTTSQVAFEFKLLVNSAVDTTNHYFGIGNHVGTAKFTRARFRYNQSTGKLEYETEEDTFEEVPGGTIKAGFISAANGIGDRWIWIRVVIDIVNDEYVSVQFVNDELETVYLDNDLPEITGTLLETNIVPFVSVQTPNTTPAEAYTADWIVTSLE